MPTPLHLKAFSTSRGYEATAEAIHHTKESLRYKVYGTGFSIIIEKDLTLNNIPWKLIEGKIPGVSTPDLFDMVRQAGAEIERGGTSSDTRA